MLRVLAATVAAALPHAGVLVPGTSLGGLRLGATPKQVRTTWGTFYGRCSNCSSPTWYFTYGRFKEQGAAVQFRGGRAEAILTLWQPPGWRTPQRLKIGDPSARVTEVYGALPRAQCEGYYALTIVAPRSVTAFYVVDEKLWGFGLMRPAVPACRA